VSSLHRQHQRRIFIRFLFFLISIDATAETGKLGRLVNHSRNGNLITKTVMVGNSPHLVLIAKDDLEKGVELTYDYGDRSKEALQHHPWLAL
jgi:[histone H4]-lysine20 N-methyltransferase SETD8